jgi:HlyD family secretion protein
LSGTVQSIPLSVKRNEVGSNGSVSMARSYAIKVKLQSTKDLVLRPGMTCRAEIYTATAGQSLAVPVQAVMSNNDEKTIVPDGSSKPDKGKPTVKEESYVFVDKDGVADKRIVKTGISDDARQEVLSGIKAGEVIIVGPYKILRHLASGDKIKAEDKVQ